MSETAPTVRRQLAEVRPHVSMKVAIRTLIRALRSGASAGERHPLASRAALERCLGAVVTLGPETATGIKTQLRAVVSDPTPRSARAAADQLLAAVPWPLEPDAPCSLAVGPVPPQVGAGVLVALMGCAPGLVTARQAALARHRADGLVVGGVTMGVSVELARGRCLPAVPRQQRADKGRWGRAAPWLPHLDDVGRHSLTPRALADRMVSRAGALPRRVVDACCGCGGNTVAFARAGVAVVGVELDDVRARMARENARALGVDGRVSIRAGSIENLLEHVLEPGDLLFVDPPWRGDSGARGTTFEALFERLPRLADAVRSVDRVMLKLPRTFAVQSLPGGSEAWTLSYELGSADTGDAHVVRMITAVRWRERIDPSDGTRTR